MGRYTKSIFSGLWIFLLILFALFMCGYAYMYITVTDGIYPFPPQSETYAAKHLWIGTHVGFGTLALITGIIQFNGPIRRNFPRVHRLTGRFYVAAVAISVIASVGVAPFAAGGFSNSVAFFIGAGLWSYSTLKGVLAIRAGRVTEHKCWMIRSFALTLAALSLRVELLFLVLLPGVSFSEAYLTVPWTCFFLNLVIAEWFVIDRPNPGKGPVSVEALQATLKNEL